jgi:5' nucleotidase, deoxy (Pyrimidine), cytosolic type C protein (NT5C)
MALRIGFDLDGVLADLDAALRQHCERLFGTVRGEAPSARDSAPPDDSEEAATTPAETPVVQLDLSVRQERQLWRHVSTVENFWEGLQEIEAGAIARLASLAHERAWEIIFLTKRPRTAGATAQVQSQRWLEAKGFALPSVFVVQGSRGRIAKALDLDIVVDDRPENCLDVITESSARAILVWRATSEATTAQRLGIGTVSTVAECLDVCEEIEARSRQQRGMLERVKRMLSPSSHSSSKSLASPSTPSSSKS